MGSQPWTTRWRLAAAAFLSTLSLAYLAAFPMHGTYASEALLSNETSRQKIRLCHKSVLVPNEEPAHARLAA